MKSNQTTNESNPNMSDPATKPSKPSVRRSAQDTRIMNAITATEGMIETALEDEAATALLKKRGWDTKKLGNGLKLQQSAQSAFNARQDVMGRRKSVRAEAKAKREAARRAYVDFRETVRAHFAAEADRERLGATGAVAADLDQFVTQARASYATAQQEPYLEVLAEYGYPAATLQELEADLEAVVKACGEHRGCRGDALQATQDRDEAYAAMQQWVSRFRQAAKIAFRGKPDLAAKFDF